MQQELKLTNQQKQQFEIRMNAELDRIIMSWDNDLKNWYPNAIRALNFASPASLSIPQTMFIELFKHEPQGLKMQVVGVLANNIESRTPVEMEVTARDWAQFLILNASIGARWNELHRPVYKKVYKEFEIMTNKPNKFIVGIGEA